MKTKNDENTTVNDECEELIRVLMLHAVKYPLMRPEDVVKLIYQNEFGSGHFIRDEKECFERLRREAESVAADENIPLSEDIGNGVRRVNLNCAEKDKLPLEELNAAFIALSKTHRGELTGFCKKLAAVSEHFSDLGFGFPEEEFRTYLSEYENAGFPPVSHSEIYRENYHPAYRLTGREIAV